MPTLFMKCLTVLYLHYNEAMQNFLFLFLFFIVCKYSHFPGAANTQLSRYVDRGCTFSFEHGRTSVGFDLTDIFYFVFVGLFSCRMQRNCRCWRCKSVKTTPLKFTDHLQRRTKTQLLLYGHLYVVALLICAFLLMGEKIKKSMQEIFHAHAVTDPYLTLKTHRNHHFTIRKLRESESFCSQNQQDATSGSALSLSSQLI